MGTPLTPESINDALHDLGGTVVSTYIRNDFPKGAVILDVGAGWGKYARLLPEYTMDAVEIWKPYIEEENLENLYRQVFNVDICDFEIKPKQYDAIILGDVLEHIEENEAVELIERLKPVCKQLYIVVPYQYHQGEVHGNKYEIHLQDKLTDTSVKELYGVKLLVGDDVKGVYIK